MYKVHGGGYQQLWGKDFCFNVKGMLCNNIAYPRTKCEQLQASKEPLLENSFQPSSHPTFRYKPISLYFVGSHSGWFVGLRGLNIYIYVLMLRTSLSDGSGGLLL